MTNPNNIVRVRARNGGRASVYEANAWAQAYSSGLLEGNGVTQNTSADMNVLVGGSSTKPDVILAENPAGYRIALDIVGQQAVAITAPASNSRISAIVAYTDDLALSTTEDTVTGSPASCGLIVVNGTALASPSAPTDMQIRNAITADGATGSQASYCVLALITVPSGATAITDSMISISMAGIGSQNIDFATMKKWVPDYDNVSSTNLWQNKASVTMTDVGFVTCAICSYHIDANTDVKISVNGLTISRNSTEARGPNQAVVATTSALIPVSPSDVIAYDADGGSINYKTCYFIPGKWV